MYRLINTHQLFLTVSSTYPFQMLPSVNKFTSVFLKYHFLWIHCFMCITPKVLQIIATGFMGLIPDIFKAICCLIKGFVSVQSLMQALHVYVKLGFDLRELIGIYLIRKVQQNIIMLLRFLRNESGLQHVLVHRIDILGLRM